MKVDPKEVSTILRMAGNIAGALIGVMDASLWDREPIEISRRVVDRSAALAFLLHEEIRRRVEEANG